LKSNILQTTGIDLIPQLTLCRSKANEQGWSTYFNIASTQFISPKK